MCDNKNDNEVEDLLKSLIDLFVIDDDGIHWGYMSGIALNRITSYGYEKQLFKYMNDDMQRLYLETVPKSKKKEYKELMKK